MANKKQPTIKIRGHNLLDAKKDSSFKKWKLFICKIINIPILHKYQFVYNINYYGGRIYEGDVVINSQKVGFAVMSASKGIATIMTTEPRSEQPRTSGVFHVLSKKQYGNKSKTKK